MSTEKKLPTRRDRREAEGYLTDLFTNTHGIITGTEYDVTKALLDAAVEVKVQRATDRLVLYFDLDDDVVDVQILPEATTDADGIDNGGEREAVGTAFRTGTEEDPAE